MKKLLGLLTALAMSVLSLTGCHEIHKCPLESIEVTSYVKEEAHVSGALLVFCIFGSYNKDSYTVQRYIFLAGNGPLESYKINDVEVYTQPRQGVGNYRRDAVYFKYIEEGEQPYLEYREMSTSMEVEYFLYLPRSTVLELAHDMFIN